MKKRIGLLIIFCVVLSGGWMQKGFCDTIINQHIYQDTDWDASGSPYIVNIELMVNATLTIHEGVVVKFNGPFTGMFIGWFGSPALIAAGTQANPVIFTSNSTTPQKGDWNCIYFNYNASPASRLEHCIIEYGGSYRGSNVYLNLVSPSISNCIIRESKQDGIYLAGIPAYGTPLSHNQFNNNARYPLSVDSPGNLPDIDTTNSFSGNGIQAINTGTGMITADRHWKDIGIPYISEWSITVNNYSIFTIDPGVVIKFTGGGFQISTDSGGTLCAIGTEDKPILFTSNKATPSPGDWNGIYFSWMANPSSIMEHCIVEYGGLTSGANIYFYDASATVRCTTVRYSYGNGIAMEGRSKIIKPTLEYNDINYNMRHGIYIFLSAQPIIKGNNIENNVAYGLYNDTWNSNTVDATANWWGTAADPSSKIFGLVNYAPWLTSRATCVPRTTLHPPCENNATLITLASFNAVKSDNGVAVRWVTESEVDSAGFNIYRAAIPRSRFYQKPSDDDYVMINTQIIPAEGSPATGSSYQFMDTDVNHSITYYYKLEEIDNVGEFTQYGPVSVVIR